MQKLLCILGMKLFFIVSVKAQTFYSNSLNQMFIGPDNVMNITAAYKVSYLMILDKAMNKLNASNNSNIDLELSSLGFLDDAWRKYSVTKADGKFLIIEEYSARSEISRLATRRVGDRVETLEIRPKGSSSKWIKCGGGFKNCLSADPKDCLRQSFKDGSIIYKDDFGNKIPYRYFLQNFEQLKVNRITQQITLEKHDVI